ncbi:hypothetical protein DFQ50_101205 [Pseudocitrobacter faecalis]|uniref:Uncharacterized protein n=1 Tax=Pseudocitrobacter faecalis TaxID=1398493 RepID=A0ABX9G6J7_9ENTR|nr:hypothetical protein DFQ50_101205 [Pseudocitrobacter faecalis]
MISDRRRDNRTHSIIRRQIQFNIIYIMRTNTEPDKIPRVAVMTVLVANIPPKPVSVHSSASRVNRACSLSTFNLIAIATLFGKSIGNAAVTTSSAAGICSA